VKEDTVQTTIHGTVDGTVDDIVPNCRMKCQLEVSGDSVPNLLTVKISQPSHEFTFGVGISFIPYPLVLTPVV
jgi:hypothetical protein